jgi:hypothetical protein
LFLNTFAGAVDSLSAAVLWQGLKTERQAEHSAGFPGGRLMRGIQRTRKLTVCVT